MATIPIWCLGRNVSAAVLTPQTIDAAGVLSDTTPTVALAAKWQNLRVRSKNTLEETSASDQRRENDVIVSTRTDYEVDLIFKNVNSSNDEIGAFFGSVDYFKWVQTQGGKTFTGYAVAGSFELAFEGKGAGRCHITFGYVDPGAANPAVS